MSDSMSDADRYNAMLANIAVELARRLRDAARSAEGAGPDMYAPGGIPERVRENVLVGCLKDVRDIERLLAMALKDVGVQHSAQTPRRSS